MSEPENYVRPFLSTTLTIDPWGVTGRVIDGYTRRFLVINFHPMIKVSLDEVYNCNTLKEAQKKAGIYALIVVRHSKRDGTVLEDTRTVARGGCLAPGSVLKGFGHYGNLEDMSYKDVRDLWDC